MVNTSPDAVGKEKWMRLALAEAKKAEMFHEVPTGTVVVLGRKVIERGYNLKETTQDAATHTEMLAIKEACEKVGNWRLEDTAFFVTLEPCPMCSGAMILFRVAEVCFDAYDPKGGTAGTLTNLLEDERFNHQAYVEGGILEDECGMVLTDFFRKLRQRKKELKKDWLTNEK